MKKLLLTLLTALAVTLTAKAAPAYPFPITVTQPDGTELTILLHGDEHFNWTTTADGVLLAGVNNAYYVAGINSNGQLEATSQLAHNEAQRTTAELSAVNEQQPRQQLFFEQGHRRAALHAPAIGSGSYFPHSGSPRVLIILTAFSDLDFTLPDPVKSFGQYFNGEGTMQNYGNNEDRNFCSVTEYYNISSNGQFKPQFDIVGPVALPNKMAYYGGTSGNGGDEKFTQLCQDACDLVKDQVNFADYDNDGDGKAELIYVLHAGFGQNTGGPVESMWAKCGTLGISVNGTTIVRGGCHSELFRGTTINGIGVFCHEFSHGMGLPDLYVTSGTPVINQSMQSWDVMDYGLYNENIVTGDDGTVHYYSSYAPAAYTAWEQEIMGWNTIQQLETGNNYQLTPLIEGGNAYKIQNPEKPNEYIVFENIQKHGLNNGARGHGLLAYHIDYNSNTMNMGDSPNNTAGRPRVAVIPSGGLQFARALAGDGKAYTVNEWEQSHAATPFPGTKAVNILTDQQELPNFCFYSNNTAMPVGHGIYNITEGNEGIVSFDYDLTKWQAYLEPVTKEATVTFTEGDMEDEIIDNIYYNLPGNNGYDAAEECIVINDVPSMEVIGGDTQLNFIGLIFMVNDKGVIELDAQTIGSMKCGVRFGEGEAQLFTKDERGIIEIAYDVTEPTIVYVFAYNDVTTRAPRLVEAQENCLKLWSLSIKPGATTGIERPTPGPSLNGGEWYDLQGRKLNGQPTAKGIYIRNGRKVTL